MLGKGFVRILEVVVFSYLLFVLLIPTFFDYYDLNDWSEVQSYTICNDLLYSLEKSDVLEEVFNPYTSTTNYWAEHEDDKELLLNLTDRFFPAAFEVNYEVKNVPGYEISVGCNCTPNQIIWLEDRILTPNHPPARYTIENVSLSDLSEFEPDVLVIFGEENLSLYEEGISEILDEGKGVVLVRNFTSEPDLFTKELFDLEYTSGSSSQEDLSFNNLSDSVTTGIAKRMINNLFRINLTSDIGEINLKNETYSVNLSRSIITGTEVRIANCSSVLNVGESCDIDEADAKIYLFTVSPTDEWIDIRISESSGLRDYYFYDEFLQTVPVGNSTILSYGGYAGANARVLESYTSSYFNDPRVFWMYDYDKNKDDLNLLLKTGITWAAGEHFVMFDENEEMIGQSSSCQHFYSGLNGNNIPFVVKLYFYGY